MEVWTNYLGVIVHRWFYIFYFVNFLPAICSCLFLLVGLGCYHKDYEGVFHPCWLLITSAMVYVLILLVLRKGGFGSFTLAAVYEYILTVYFIFTLRDVEFSSGMVDLLGCKGNL